jgi:hypothetical protein
MVFGLTEDLIMTCDYFTYTELAENLFYGVALTDNNLNYATEQLRRYLIDGGAREVLNALGIGIRIRERQNRLFPELNEVIEKRFVFIDGEHKGRDLTINEIINIGMFLKHGACYGKLKGV